MKPYSICLSVLSLSIIPSRSIYVIKIDKISFFFFMAEQYLIVYIHHTCIHSSISGYVGCFHILAICFHILAIVNTTVMNMGVLNVLLS